MTENENESEAIQASETDAPTVDVVTSPPGKRNQRIRQRIATALRERGADGVPLLRLVCSLCGHREFTIGSYVPLGLSLSPQNQGMFAPKVYPCVAVICKHCGNTYLLNLGVLGFNETDWEDLTLAESDDAD